MLERDNAENLGPSGRVVVGGFGVSVETAVVELFISIFGSATFSIGLFSLPLPLLLKLPSSLTFSTIE
jgi:hypothetical protein